MKQIKKLLMIFLLAGFVTCFSSCDVILSVLEEASQTENNKKDSEGKTNDKGTTNDTTKKKEGKTKD